MGSFKFAKSQYQKLKCYSKPGPNVQIKIGLTLKTATRKPQKIS